MVVQVILTNAQAVVSIPGIVRHDTQSGFIQPSGLVFPLWDLEVCQDVILSRIEYHEVTRYAAGRKTDVMFVVLRAQPRLNMCVSVLPARP